MRTLAHLSDLHFGRADPAVVQSLLDDVRGQRADLVVVSGDLTQRARPWQFAQARAFLDRLPEPRLMVPGNHDIAPFHRPLERLLDPFGAYRRYIAAETEPLFVDDEIAVLGVNTARAHLLREGRISSRQLDVIRARFSGSAKRTKIVVTHHPFIPLPIAGRTNIVGHARRALEALEECGVELLLAGHLHHAFSADVVHHHSTIKRSMLVAQATTTTSTRLRSDPNAYNLIELGDDQVTITVRAFAAGRFDTVRVDRYLRNGHRWLPATA
ncbi:MAG TPA: metallophosphoesterase [Polyangiaceae bacterium]|nr:metallophosphoesterase [Polyangiaceae bacterium]